MEKTLNALLLTEVKTLAQQKQNENDIKEGMRRTVTSKKKASTEILTRFTCKEGTYLIIIVFRNIFLKNADSVCKFSLRFSKFVWGTVLWTPSF